jgi:hypothetical protein
MTTSNEAEIILYDLASTKGLCFSPVVWRIRLMLNYKHIPYRTVFLEFPDIEPTLKELSVNMAYLVMPSKQHWAPVSGVTLGQVRNISDLDL